LLVVILLGYSSTLCAQTVFSDSGYSTVTISTHPDTTATDSSATDGVAPRTPIIDQIIKTVSYHVEEFGANWMDTVLLITETSTQHSQSNLEGEDGAIELTGRILQQGNFGDPVWKLALHSNFIEYGIDYFSATDYGCCGAENVKRIYRYSDGALLLTLTSDVGEVSIPNSQTHRYVGYWDLTNTEEESDLKDSTIIGILTMIDPENLREQRMTVKFSDPNYAEQFGVNPFDTLSFGTFTAKDSKNYNGGRTFDLWSADGNRDPDAYSNFSIKLIYELPDEGFTTVEVPVRNGKLDISGLRSKWFTFEPR
jgi:hypothetical protein